MLTKLCLILLSRGYFFPAKGYFFYSLEQTIGLIFLPDFLSLLLGSASPSDGMRGRSGENLGLKLVAHAATMSAASTTRAIIPKVSMQCYLARGNRSAALRSSYLTTEPPSGSKLLVLVIYIHLKHNYNNFI